MILLHYNKTVNAIKLKNLRGYIKMGSKVMRIDEEKCIGCGLCANVCQQSAIEIIHGKARLISDSLCDGLGNCLPECPTGAITLVDREDQEPIPQNIACGCPGTNVTTIKRNTNWHENTAEFQIPIESHLNQWPCQIQLVPVNAPYFENAKLLVAADCTAFAYANIHRDYMEDKITIIGCPKLDNVDYASKLTQILKTNNIKSVTVLRMSVPCCGGLVYAVQKALMDSNKMIPWQVVTIGTDGSIIDQ